MRQAYRRCGERRRTLLQVLGRKSVVVQAEAAVVRYKSDGKVAEQTGRAQVASSRPNLHRALPDRFPRTNGPEVFLEAVRERFSDRVKVRQTPKMNYPYCLLFLAGNTTSIPVDRGLGNLHSVRLKSGTCQSPRSLLPAISVRTPQLGVGAWTGSLPQNKAHV